MEALLEQIRDQQKATWNKFSPGWRIWDGFTMAFLKPMGDEIIRSLRLKDTDTVLDIAGGTGEPGLTIAQIVKKGKVVITDLAEKMLDVAKDNAKQKGITNIETLVCDVSELPFENNTFDAVSCRMGFMFFPDMLMAIKEMQRVVKPGGRIATSVWGAPQKNFWVTAIMSNINKNMDLPAPPPGSPGMFRCGAPGQLAGLFREAGLKNITEKEITGKLNCGTIDTYWDYMNEVGAPIVAAMSKADQPTRDKIKTETFETVAQQCGDHASLDYASIIVTGEK